MPDLARAVRACAGQYHLAEHEIAARVVGEAVSRVDLVVLPEALPYFALDVVRGRLLYAIAAPTTAIAAKVERASSRRKSSATQAARGDGRYGG